MEQVLVVARAHIGPYIENTGVIRERIGELLEIIKKNAEFLPRADAEENPDYKQIIPYVAVVKPGRVFASRRLGAGGEARLHGLISIGFGGHINPADDDGGNPLMEGLRRELGEELCVESPGALRFLGVINDDTNAVGSVHLGLLFSLEAGGDVAVLETEKLEGFWLEAQTLPDYYEEMETWSQLASGVLAEADNDMG